MDMKKPYKIIKNWRIFVLEMEKENSDTTLSEIAINIRN